MVFAGPSDTKHAPASPMLFGGVLGLDLLYSVYLLKPWIFFFSCDPAEVYLFMTLITLPPHCSSQCWKWRFPSLLCLSLTILSLCGLSICCSAEAVQLALSSFLGGFAL